MVLSTVMTPSDMYNSIGCNLPLLLLVWGSMIIAFILQERGGFLTFLFSLIEGNREGGRRAVVSINLLIWINAVWAALIGWDTASVTMSPLVIDLCRRRRWPLKPFALALTTSSNIGSVLTPIAAPGNLIVVYMSIAAGEPIYFAPFIGVLALPWIIGLIVSSLVVTALFWKTLAKEAVGEFPSDSEALDEEKNSEGNEDSPPEALPGLDLGRPLHRQRSVSIGSHQSWPRARTLTRSLESCALRCPNAVLHIPLELQEHPQRQQLQLQADAFGGQAPFRSRLQEHSEHSLNSHLDPMSASSGVQNPEAPLHTHRHPGSCAVHAQLRDIIEESVQRSHTSPAQSPALAFRDSWDDSAAALATALPSAREKGGEDTEGEGGRDGEGGGGGVAAALVHESGIRRQTTEEVFNEDGACGEKTVTEGGGGGVDPERERESEGEGEEGEERDEPKAKKGRISLPSSQLLGVWFHRYSVYLIFVCALLGWLMGLEMGAIATVAASLSLAFGGEDFFDLLTRLVEHPVIYYIVFIFPTVGGFMGTGVPGALWMTLTPFMSLVQPLGLALLVAMTVVYTQLVSTVPTVLLLGSSVMELSEREGLPLERGFLCLAFIVAVSGALTTNASIAQVICYGAVSRASGGRVIVSNLEQLLVGVPIVFLTLLGGLPVIMAAAGT
uniref:Citrate transporter-like domain-containing protein n=1 Tax=Chromera velia CCMP2878 TaxID=1169474 RepID=A0A0G4HGX2_9ALVE|eukprot:Cvel_27385.t1-p1 / transcript=Cvel_27385.t1 / gene=Cvel_27385 / organism=Chromera_velia_CCMP2878 / gene_product=Putative transporter arsB, putative / transcript_product=Putative transporter arsB, putative / location=Cvel_scaffold3409:2651-6472(-) / protein_length=669 / sequence_SO=supercontig / SO=protein_coding / is_pseudo=false